MSLLALRSTTPARIDALRQEHATVLVQVLGIVAFACLAALGAQVRVYVWEIPFTLQTAAVYGSGLVLGWRSGFLSMALYLALGLFLPVFAGDTYGPAYLLGASGGYLLAYPLVAALIGFASKRWNGFAGSLLAMALGSVVLFSCGVTVYHFAADHATWMESIEKGWLRFIPIDVAKILLVGSLYAGVRRMK